MQKKVPKKKGTTDMMIRLLALMFALALAGPARAQPTTLVPSTTASVALPTSTQAMTKLVSGVAGKSIYLTALHMIGAGAAVVTWSSGTGTNCGSNTVTLNAPETLATGSVTNLGSGLGAVMVVPAGSDLCLTVGTAAVSGWVAYGMQ
jgi:hypothetical protein